jgi:hypothetical protein
MVKFRVDGGVGIDEVVGGEAGGTGEIFRDGLPMFDRFDEVAFGLFAFKDFEVIGWYVFISWGKVIFDALV